MKNLLFLVAVLLASTAFTGAQDLIERTQQNLTYKSSPKENYNPNRLAKYINQNRQNSKTSNAVNVFKFSNSRSEKSAQNVSTSIELELNEVAVNQLLKAKQNFLTLKVPVSETNYFELELVRDNIQQPAYQVRTSKTTALKSHPKAEVTFYKGIIKNDEQSLAAVTISNNQIRILASDIDGNYVVGKMPNTNSKYVLYNDVNLLSPPEYTCNTPEEPEEGNINVSNTGNASIAGECVPIYIEADFAFFEDNGSSVNNVEVYLNGLFNEVETIYFNESIEVSISEIFVHTEAGPFVDISSTAQGLNRFQELRQDNFNGRLAHLITGRPLNAGQARIDVLCSINENHAISALYSTYNTFPAYTWDLYVFAHEMGHNFGSRHTHACVWNGNNTAIDSCDDFTEGSCALPGSPASGGTVMSYCHKKSDIGINFSLGFGPQPGDFIRDKYNNSNCILECGVLPPNTIVEQHGRLQVSGKYVANQYNQKISLAGNSLYWSNFSEGSKFYNAETVNHLAQNWNSSIVRAAMGADHQDVYPPNNGYIFDGNDEEKDRVKTIVDAAIGNGIYVIIDWHSHHAEDYQQEAIDFFTEMAEQYGAYDNVIYEIYNEPIGTSWSEIKSYAEAVISAIRSKDPDNLIIVGTRFYSQKVVEASLNPINDVNVAYTLHFYAAEPSHKNFRADALEAMNNGIPIFVTEWGTVEADGDGDVNYYQTDLWMDFMKENFISHANWSIGDKNEGASTVTAGAGIEGLVTDQLTESGRKVKAIIQNWNVTPLQIEHNPSNGSTRFEAENAVLDGVTTSNTNYNNISNGEYVTGITDDGDQVVFNNIVAPAAGLYPLTIRYASTSYKENYVNVNGAGRENISFETATAFTNKTITVNLNAGNNTIAIEKHWGWFDVDYIEIDGIGNEEPEPPQPNETTRVEAENGQATGVNNQTGTSASNGEFVTDFHDEGDQLAVSINVSAPGTYQLNIGYRSTGGDKKNDIYLNDTFLGNIQFVQSDTFTDMTVGEFYFEAGENIVEFVKSWGWMDVDYFEIVATGNQNAGASNNLCNRTLQVSYNTTADYYVAGIINANATVVANHTTEFVCKETINLQNNFTVEKGARFLASIEACDE